MYMEAAVGRHKNQTRYLTSETAEVLQRVTEMTKDSSLVQSLHISPTMLTFLRRFPVTNGIVIADTPLAEDALDKIRLQKMKIRTACYLDDSSVLEIAEKRKITRAQVAAEFALTQPGQKLFLVGSAPMTVATLLERHRRQPLRDVAVIATPTGYSSVIALKEQLWESGLPVIVSRGKAGGVQCPAILVNALLQSF